MAGAEVMDETLLWMGGIADGPFAVDYIITHVEYTQKNDKNRSEWRARRLECPRKVYTFETSRMKQWTNGNTHTCKRVSIEKTRGG